MTTVTSREKSTSIKNINAENEHLKKRTVYENDRDHQKDLLITPVETNDHVLLKKDDVHRISDRAIDHVLPKSVEVIPLDHRRGGLDIDRDRHQIVNDVVLVK